MNDSEIVSVISRKLAPFILLYGLYLVSHGHLSPGGGFQGGVILSSAIILLFLSRGINETLQTISIEAVKIIEILCFFLFIAMGVAGIAFGKQFLGNFLPLGIAGEMPSAGFIFFLNLVIGIKVGAGITLICYYLFREE